MGRIVAVVNQKGGVGKTTTCVNLTCALNQLGVKTLLVDCDPQGNATSGLGLDKRRLEKTAYDAIINGVPMESVIVSTPYGDLVPSNQALAGAGVELVELSEREFVLRRALEPVQTRYDLILIDCPPSLELLTLNALCAADGVIIPVQCEYYALEGLADLMGTLELVRKSLNPALEIDGMLLTMSDGRTSLSAQVAAEVRRHFPQYVFPVVIPRNVRLSEAPSHGEPVMARFRVSKGARAYGALAALLKRRLKPGKQPRRKTSE